MKAGAARRSVSLAPASTPPRQAVLINVVRGGRDPDDFWHVVTADLAAALDAVDPLRDFSPLEDQDDPRILATYLGSREDAEKTAIDLGYEVSADDIDADGY